jgi:diguanylate cyclase (GGDEF)-like protein
VVRNTAPKLASALVSQLANGTSSRSHSLPFGDAIAEVLSNLRAHTNVPNWVLTRNHSDGVVVLASSSDSSKTQGKAFHYRQRPFTVLSADVFDERVESPYGSLIGYVTENDTPGVESKLAELSAAALSSLPLVELMGSMLSDVLRSQRGRADEDRITERIAYCDIDPLTGLHERSSWLRLIELEGARLAQFEDDAIVVLIDVPELHTLNAEQGYEAGNELLREIALALRTSVPHDRILSRIRSDDFGVALIGANPAHQLLALRRGIALAGLSLSLGVGQRCAGEPNLTPAIERADRSIVSNRYIGQDNFAHR